MALEVTGNVIAILPEQSGVGKNGNWVKQEFVIETMEQYPKKICFSSFGDKAALVKALQVGQNIRVSFNAESREYNGRWYTDLRIWKLENNTSSPENHSGYGSDMPDYSEKNNSFNQMDIEGSTGDLPF